MKFFKKRTRQNYEPTHRIFKPKRIRTPRFRTRRIIILGITLVTLLFIAKILLGFFNIEHVSFALNGNFHYTDAQVFDVLGENLDNIITNSEEKTAAYLKENLSYIEDVWVTRNLAKRQLTIEITERNSFARVKHILLEEKDSEKAKRNNTDQLFLINEAGYVLESITPENFKKTNHMALILDEGTQSPEIGKQINTETTQLGIRILKEAKSKEPALATNINSIDARISQQITIHIESLPMPVWIAEDMIEIGLHHVGLFVRQRGLSILQNERKMTKTEAGVKASSSPLKYTYLDARYEETLYVGGAN